MLCYDSAMISPEDIEKLASLGRLDLSREEKERLGTEIESILGYISEIQHVVGEAEVPLGKQELRNVVREDNDVDESGIYSKMLLDEAPDRERNYVRVKKIL